MERKAFGIDLGTTYSAIAVYEDGGPRLLPNIDGADTTPSVLFFNGVTASGDDEIIVGQEAKNYAASEPDNTVQFIKRRMGQSGQYVDYVAPSGKIYNPEMLSSFILKKLCKDASSRVDFPVKDVVITVPAYYDDARRVATRHAGTIAGLNVLAVLNEPTAAAIAFGLGREWHGRVLVYDLGGGTFDVTIMDIDGNRFRTVATDGDHALGGFNFDGRMVELILKKLGEQGITIDDEDDQTFADIRERAEKAKRILSDYESTNVRLRGVRGAVQITREEFEKATADLLMRTKVILESTMEAAETGWNGIDQLLVIGGSTKMPMVKRMLKEISGMETAYQADPDTAVAEGAAIFAGTFDLESGDGHDARDSDRHPSVGRDGEEGIAGISIRDVTSQSLGVITVDEFTRKRQNTIVIPHNTPIPARCSKVVYTLENNQTQVLIQVTEGNDEDVEYVNVIGSSTLTLPAYPKGSPMEVIYAYDPDQTIYIEVIDRVANRSMGTFEIDRSSNMSDHDIRDARELVGRACLE